MPEGQIYQKTNYYISAILRGAIKSKDQIEKKTKELIRKKKLSQPSQIKTGGSTFQKISKKQKRHGMLIKESGCDKIYVGDAGISRKHCNFFVNNGKANSADIETLINKVKQPCFLNQEKI